MVYICVPVHNEEPTVGVLLWKVRKVMAGFDRDYEILVLDDASTDGTGDVLERYRDILPLRILRSEERVGYGRALEGVLREAAERALYPRRDVAVTLQADFTEDPEGLVAMVKAIEGGADLVAGRMEENGRGIPRAIRITRRIAPFLLGRGYRNAPVSDPLSGFRAYRIVVLKKAFRELEAGDASAGRGAWASNLRLLHRTVPHARRVEETPFRARFAHRSRESRFRAVPSLRELIGLRGLSWPAEGGAS